MAERRRTFDAMPDRIDVRDWRYRPMLEPLPDELVPALDPDLVLDQGSDGACTGHALAAVINALKRARGEKTRVSPWMLYAMARRYDEWPGEGYDGSSARGAMAGWVRHGVCSEKEWQDGVKAQASVLDRCSLTPKMAAEALATPGGAYYRVMHREVRDVHAALAEVGIVYATLMVHSGWFAPSGPLETVRPAGPRRRAKPLELPTIARKGRADDGHAVALVGYTRNGFLVQNSWGPLWGHRGYALLPYEDFLLHATDVWVAQLGVPVNLDLWAKRSGADSLDGRPRSVADSAAGRSRAARSIPIAEIRPFVIDVADDGELSNHGRYWTTPEDLRRLFSEEIPVRTEAWKRRRVMLFVHGGLDDEATVAKRVVAFRDVLLANDIYPLHVMWETQVFSALRKLLAEVGTEVGERDGPAGTWWRELRHGLELGKNRAFELSVARRARALWKEMGRSAAAASKHEEGRGAMQLLVREAKRALERRGRAKRKRWELHVVAHGAGGVFAAHAVRLLSELEVGFATVQLLAPAVSATLFQETFLRAVESGAAPHPTVYVRSDEVERADTFGLYGRSPLFLVSNAFEGSWNTPVVGMERFVAPPREQADGATRWRKSGTHAFLVDFFTKTVDGRPSLVVAGRTKGEGSISEARTHLGFDRDPETMNSVLTRVLGAPPKRRFTERDLVY